MCSYTSVGFHTPPTPPNDFSLTVIWKWTLFRFLFSHFSHAFYICQQITSGPRVYLSDTIKSSSCEWWAFLQGSRSPRSEGQWQHTFSSQVLQRPIQHFAASTQGVLGKQWGQRGGLDPAMFSWLVTGLFLKVTAISETYEKLHTHTSRESTDSYGWMACSSGRISYLLCSSCLQTKRLQRYFVPCLRVSFLSGTAVLGSKSHQCWLKASQLVCIQEKKKFKKWGS